MLADISIEQSIPDVLALAFSVFVFLCVAVFK
jgi:hypothetical protein